MRTRMKSIIGAEYRLNNSPECEALGIVGKWGRLLSVLSGSTFYVMVEGDVYRLKRSSWDLDIKSGLYGLDLLPLLSSKGLEGINISALELTGQEMAKFIEDLTGKDVYSKIDASEVFRNLVIATTYLDDYGITSELELRLSRPPVLLGRDILMTPNGTDAVQVASAFQQITGKNLWEIIKVATLLELPMCGCGGTHQRIVEFTAQRKTSVMLQCAHCERQLYFSSSSLTWRSNLPPEVIKMIEDSQKKLSEYCTLSSVYDKKQSKVNKE